MSAPIDLARKAPVQDAETRTTSGDSDKEGEDQVVYPGGMQLALLALGLCLGTFTVSLGKSINFLMCHYREHFAMHLIDKLYTFLPGLSF